MKFGWLQNLDIVIKSNLLIERKRELKINIIFFGQIYKENKSFN